MLLQADFIARSHCSAEFIKSEDIEVLPKPFNYPDNRISIQIHFFLNGQEILEKFEFFPIKCKIQRAAEQFKFGIPKSTSNCDHESSQIKSKVFLSHLLNFGSLYCPKKTCDDHFTHKDKKQESYQMHLFIKYEQVLLKYEQVLLTILRY